MSWLIEHLHPDGSILARIPVQNGRLTIGRGLDNDLVLDDAHSAPSHAELVIQNDHSALLRDLGSINGISRQREKKRPEIEITDEQPLRVGSSWVRVRSSAWPLAPEKPITQNRTWIWALMGVLGVVGEAIWEVWLSDLESTPPPYLYYVAGLVGVLVLWSAVYAVYGRLASGADRYLRHLLIACFGYLGLNLLDNGLGMLGFMTGWVWPLQWLPYLVGLGVALIVGTHLHTADPRHWPKTRWALGMVTVVAMAVPLAQQWISRKEFTDVHTMNIVTYPSLRLAQPATIDRFLKDVNDLKALSDLARKDPDMEQQDFMED
ncbi:MAG: FHA domain-containing protein [Burkholderiaceae bacterium]